jgi:hypothetical protein
MPSRVALLITGLLVALAQPAAAQQPLPLPATPPLQFESWQAELDHGPTLSGTMVRVQRDRKNRWLIGGAIGAVAGVVACTAISTIIDDSAEGGLSFCPLDTYLLMGGAGFVLGAVIGAVT